MREANWDEIFQRKPAGPEEDDRLSAIFPWENWLTFAILSVVFMSVVASIDSANWVDDMPSLYPIGFSALIAGYAFSRIRWNELLVHPIALLAGAGLVYLQIMVIVPGGSIVVRSEALVDRMHAWWSAVTQEGISTDELPFIVMVLTLTWLAAYISSWAVFRWRNPWIALVPGGTALMWNISFIPGQFSYAFVVFLFGAVLLLTRLHVAHQEARWDRNGIRYPEFISLSVLNLTFWVTVGLLVAVWLMPLASRSETASERWQDFTSPITRHFTPLGRVFISVNAKKPVNVHNLKDALPFQGKITLNSRDAAEIEVKITPEMAAFLRERSFDEYTTNGWKINVEGVALPPGERTDVPVAENTGGARQELTVKVTVEGGNDDHLFSVGQPVAADIPAEARVGESPEDISSLEPEGGISNGDSYSVTGSVSIASIDQLQAAGTDYPEWTDPYTELPGDVPSRVARKALEITAGAETPYEQAVAVERYLRTFPIDYNVTAAPAGRDGVDYFLFDAQRGYFDYHASAMAVMLRTLGVPSRVATGYVIDSIAREGETDVYRLTQRNAFAWPEVYFPGIGWVEFSPTPSEALIERPGTAPEPTPAAAPSDGTAREPDIGIVPPGPIEAPAPIEEPGGGRGVWFVLLSLAIVGGVALAVVAGGRFAWEYGLGGLPQSAKLWEKTRRLASLAKSGARESETPREFARRLRRDIPGAEPVTYIEATYERSRFGHKALTEEESERLETAWSSVRGALLRRVLRIRSRE
jgi:transglutaminase-like putative cysteine protease